MQDWWQQTLDAVQDHMGGLRIAVYGSGGAPSHHLGLVGLWGGSPRVIHANAIASGGLSNFDAVIFPGGGLFAMAGQINPLGPQGIAEVRKWVEAGGTYIGSCAGSCHPLRMSDPYRAALPAAAEFQMCNLTPLNAAAGDWGLDSPGTGRLRVQAEPHPLMEGLSGEFEVVHYNGPLFPPQPGTAGRVLASGSSFTPFEASLGLQTDSTTLSRAIAQGARMAFRQQVGAGQIILFGSHPEFGGSALQLGWLPAVRMLANAFKLVPARGQPAPMPGAINPSALEQMQHDATELQALLERIAPWGAQLPANTPPFLGYSGPELWQAAIAESQQVLSALHNWLTDCPVGDNLEGAFLLDMPPQPDQDFGFAGTRQILHKALEMTRQAEATPPSQWPAFTGAYNEFLAHPYHLVAAVYLSAAGLIAGATLQAAAFAKSNGLAQPDIPITYSSTQS